jgi:hypothetical protein
MKVWTKYLELSTQKEILGEYEERAMTGIYEYISLNIKRNREVSKKAQK